MGRELPLCTAPFTSFLIDPNGRVRPCCTYRGSVGDLGETDLQSILAGGEMAGVRRALRKGAWPKGCLSCKEREEATGWSVRRDYLPGGAWYSEQWDEGITFLEMNSSNACNLACMHCSPFFSSPWVGYEKALRGDADPAGCGAHTTTITKASDIPRMLSELDLSRLRKIMFKGGEPMMNRDVAVFLRRLHDERLLGNIEIAMVTNGSVVNPQIVDLLRHAGRVGFSISVDGVGAVQDYIRYGNSSVDRIEQTIDRLLEIEDAQFSLLTSVMGVQRLRARADRRVGIGWRRETAIGSTGGRSICS